MVVLGEELERFIVDFLKLNGEWGGCDEIFDSSGKVNQRIQGDSDSEIKEKDLKK